jgi:hypothetical protein
MAFLPWISAIFALFVIGCGPAIGDDCTNSLKCSAQNNRICDRQQPGGYCTLIGCENDSCPDQAVCVTFRPEPLRFASTWCMAACSDSSDCRESDGYRCRSASQLNNLLPNTAAVPYKPSAKFCVIPPSAESDNDAGM